MSKENNKRKKSFNNWLSNNNAPINYEIKENLITKALSDVGIKKVSLFDETEELKIRLFLSELVMKREKCRIQNNADYLSIVNILLNYAEYLRCMGENKESVENKTDTSTKKHDLFGKGEVTTPAGHDRKNDALIVSYYMARINDVEGLGYKSFNEAFRELGIILGYKPNTLKNMRDEFDPYFDNGRVGYYQRELSNSKGEFFNEMAEKTDDEIILIVKEIINAYSSEENNKKDIDVNKKRITITDKSMKEIRAKKR